MSDEPDSTTEKIAANLKVSARMVERETEALARMKPEEQFFTVRGYGLSALKTLPYNALFQHAVTWSCKFHSIPDCSEYMEVGGCFTLLSPVRHDPNMISVSLLCPRCGEEVERSDITVWLTIVPLEGAAPSQSVIETPDTPADVIDITH